MKYFELYENRITLKTDDKRNQIFSIQKNRNNSFIVSEECDVCFQQHYTKKEIIEMIKELESWVVNQTE